MYFDIFNIFLERPFNITFFLRMLINNKIYIIKIIIIYVEMLILYNTKIITKYLLNNLVLNLVQRI